MIKRAAAVTSPAIPAALLLYGIVFGFAIFGFSAFKWQWIDTIVFYLICSVWAVFAIRSRIQEQAVRLNGIDKLFLLFLSVVLYSTYNHWWGGSLKYVQYVPIFFILPYVLGRVSNAHDVRLFGNVLIWFSMALLVLICFDYFKQNQNPYPYTNSAVPVLFGQGHSVMLSGLLISAAMLSISIKIVTPDGEFLPQEGLPALRKTIGSNLLSYMLGFLSISAMVWLSSRGSLIGLILALSALLSFSSFCDWKRRVAVVAMILIAIIFTSNFFLYKKEQRDYYQSMFQKPLIASIEGRSSATSAAPSLEVGKPILGTEICSKVTDSISDRWRHYQEALAIFLSKPLTGVGANNYGFFSCTGPGWFPHSTILQVLAELGAMGGIIYLALLWGAFRRFAQAYRASGPLENRIGSLWALSFAILQLSINQFYGNYFMSAGLYFVIGIAAAYENIQPADKKAA